MPNISHRTYKPKREKRELGYKKSKEYATFYNDRRWDKLRHWYRTQNPLCEACLLEGRSVPMNEVHHLQIWRTGATSDEKWARFLDPDNLCSLCTDHHKKIHNYLNKLQLDYTSLENFVAYDIINNSSPNI